MIGEKETIPMKPYYKNFRDKIEIIYDYKMLTNGEVAIIGDNTVEITELPIGTQTYKENVLEQMLHGSTNKKDATKVTPSEITDYREYHTDTSVRFVVKFTNEQFDSARNIGFHKFFKMQKTISLNSMVLFDHRGCLRSDESPKKIMKEFFILRSQLYKNSNETCDLKVFHSVSA